MPEFIASALWKAMENAVPYPSPDAADLRELAAVHYGLPSGCFVFGNGANELIHALPRALNLKQAVIPEPAFSEYRLACLRHGTDVLSIRTEERNSFLPSLCRLEEQAADGSAVFLANPSNPSGGLLDAAALHRVVQSRPEVLWIIDESFMDYAQGAESLLHEAALLPNLVVLRSLTKFYGMAGVRCGFFHLCRSARGAAAAIPARLERECLCGGSGEGRAGTALLPGQTGNAPGTGNAGTTCSAGSPPCRASPYSRPRPTSFSSAWRGRLMAWQPGS